MLLTLKQCLTRTKNEKTNKCGNLRISIDDCQKVSRSFLESRFFELDTRSTLNDSHGPTYLLFLFFSYKRETMKYYSDIFGYFVYLIVEVTGLWSNGH